jgi:hypothetical protein
MIKNIINKKGKKFEILYDEQDSHLLIKEEKLGIEDCWNENI